MSRVSARIIERAAALTRDEWLALGEPPALELAAPRSFDEWLLRDTLETLCTLACGTPRSAQEQRLLDAARARLAASGRDELPFRRRAGVELSVVVEEVAQPLGPA